MTVFAVMISYRLIGIVYMGGKYHILPASLDLLLQAVRYIW